MLTELVNLLWVQAASQGRIFLAAAGRFWRNQRNDVNSRMIAGKFVAEVVCLCVIAMLAGCFRTESPDTVVDEGVGSGFPVTSIAVPNPFPIEVTGQHYRWQMRYPGPDGILDTADDILSDGDLHVPVGCAIDLRLKSLDYVYLLTLPEFAVKEIAVPTLEFHLPFHPSEIGESAIDGDELCGDPHPELKKRLFVDSIQDFQNWMQKQSALATGDTSLCSMSSFHWSN